MTPTARRLKYSYEFITLDSSDDDLNFDDSDDSIDEKSEVSRFSWNDYCRYINEGCSIFIIVHDLDRNPQNDSLNNETELRSKLEKLSSGVESFNKHICIPIEELEAWFWSDPEVIKYLGGEKGKAHPNPHEIKSPKEKLIELSVGENRKPRYSTNMNVELAERLNLNICSNRCASFKNLLNFLRSL